MTVQPTWPWGLSTADGIAVDCNGALCSNCNELLEDHQCPAPDPEPPLTVESPARRSGRRTKGNIVPFERK